MRVGLSIAEEDDNDDDDDDNKDNSCWVVCNVNSCQTAYIATQASVKQRVSMGSHSRRMYECMYVDMLGRYVHMLLPTAQWIQRASVDGACLRRQAMYLMEVFHCGPWILDCTYTPHVLLP